MRIYEILGLNLALWLACAGVGTAILPGNSARPNSRGLPSWCHLGFAACIGLAALLAVGGIATLLEVSALLVTWVFLAVGLTLLATHTIAHRRIPAADAAALLFVIGAVAFGFTMIAGAWAGLDTRLNPCDDLLAYLPMAHRLLDTGGLIEPWSFRRLQNLGGQTFIQAFPVGVLGDRTLRSAETLTASMFVAGLFLTHGFRRIASRLCCIVIIFLLPLIVVPRTNSAAVLLAVPLLVACFAVATEIRAALGAGAGATARRLGVAAGLLLAGCAALRLNVVPCGAVVLTVGTLTARGMTRDARLRVTGLVLGTAAAAVAAWSIALWRSSGTPAFPIFPGNANPAVHSSSDPSLHGLVEILGRALDLAGTGPYLWVTLAILVISVVARRWLPDPMLLWIASLAVLANIALLGVSLTVSARYDFTRYVFPLVATLAVFFAYEAIRGTEKIEATTEQERATTNPLMVLVGIFVLAWVFQLLHVQQDADRWRSAVTNVQNALYTDNVRSVDYQVEYGRDEYQDALRQVRADGRTIAAVDRPNLIDYQTHDIPNMDLPGWAAPGQDFPFFRGAVPKIRFLRRAGYSELLATTPASNLCYDPKTIRQVARHDRTAAVYAPYYLDWQDTLQDIMRRAPGAVRRVGPLLLIDLERADAELTAARGPR